MKFQVLRLPKKSAYSQMNKESFSAYISVEQNPLYRFALFKVTW